MKYGLLKGAAFAATLVAQVGTAEAGGLDYSYREQPSSVNRYLGERDHIIVSGVPAQPVIDCFRGAGLEIPGAKSVVSNIPGRPDIAVSDGEKIIAVVTRGGSSGNQGFNEGLATVYEGGVKFERGTVRAAALAKAADACLENSGIPVGESAERVPNRLLETFRYGKGHLPMLGR